MNQIHVIRIDDDVPKLMTHFQSQDLASRIKVTTGKDCVNERGTEQSLGASESSAVVHTVDTTSSKYHLLPPTAFQLIRLAKKSRGVKQVAEPWVDHEFVTRNLRRRLGSKIIGELLDRYTAGEHTPALAKEYEISTTGLRQLLLEEGVELRRQPITPEVSDRAVKLYDSGLTVREVVTEIGYSLGTD